jgi:hypothetical protein
MEAPTTPRSNRVTAVFQDATLVAFDLDPEASLGELAAQIGKAGRSHGGLFLPVHIRLATGRGRRRPSFGPRRLH